MYVKVTNGQPRPYTIGQLRKDNPNTSFPKNIPDATLAAYGVFALGESDKPKAKVTHKVEEGVARNVNGVWKRTWKEVPRTEGEVAEEIESAAASVRETRNALLRATDHFALTDRILSEEMRSYRQALRDITSHAAFPFLKDNHWPTKPAGEK